MTLTTKDLYLIKVMWGKSVVFGIGLWENNHVFVYYLIIIIYLYFFFLQTIPINFYCFNKEQNICTSFLIIINTLLLLGLRNRCMFITNRIILVLKK